MWELDHKESWALKNWCFWTVVLEKTLESPLDCKEIQPVNPKANQSWIFIGRTDAEAETSILWPPDVKNWAIGKDPDAGKDWRQEEKGMIEDEMVGWHHQLDGYQFEQALGVGDGQGSLACCSSGSWTWLSDWTELNWTEGFLFGFMLKFKIPTVPYVIWLLPTFLSLLAELSPCYIYPTPIAIFIVFQICQTCSWLMAFPHLKSIKITFY